MSTLLQWACCKLQFSGLNNAVPFFRSQYWWGEYTFYYMVLPSPRIVFRDPAKAGLVAQINLVEKTRKSVLAQMALSSPTVLS